MPRTWALEIIGLLDTLPAPFEAENRKKDLHHVKRLRYRYAISKSVEGNMQSMSVNTPVKITWPNGAVLVAYPNGAITFVPAGRPDDPRSTTTILLERTLPPLDDDDEDAGGRE